MLLECSAPHRMQRNPVTIAMSVESSVHEVSGPVGRGFEAADKLRAAFASLLPASPQLFKQDVSHMSTKMFTIVRCIIVNIWEIHAMKLRSTFGLNLQRLRRERRLSQEQLAHLAGCARAYLSGAEAGRRNATLDTLEALAKVLEVAPADLLKDPMAMREEK